MSSHIIGIFRCKGAVICIKDTGALPLFPDYKRYYLLHLWPPDPPTECPRQKACYTRIDSPNFFAESIITSPSACLSCILLFDCIYRKKKVFKNMYTCIVSSLPYSSYMFCCFLSLLNTTNKILMATLLFLRDCAAPLACIHADTERNMRFLWVFLHFCF